MTEDWEELEQFVERQSESAFETLVDRHFDLVWSTAARITQNNALAKDIAQEVFTDLARRSPTLSKKVVLKGWLYRATFYAAKKACRREMRRCNHELEATSWHPADAGGDSHEMEEELVKNLDEGLQHLSCKDRDLLLRRFFDKKRVNQIAHEAGISQSAAQKQVARALKRLRTWFTNQGIASSSSTIVAGLSMLGSQTAPVGLAAQVATSSLAGAAATSPWWLSLLQFQTKLMTMKTPIIISGLTVATVSIPLVIQELQIHSAAETLNDHHTQLADLGGINETHKAWIEDQETITTHQALLQDKEERDKLRIELDALIAKGAEEKAHRMTAIRQLEGLVEDKKMALDTLLNEEAFRQESRLLSSIAKDLALQVVMFMQRNDLQFPNSFSDMSQDMEEFLETGDDGVLNFRGRPLSQWEFKPSEGTIQDYIPTKLIVIREREAHFHNGKYIRIYGFGDSHSETVARDTLSELDEFEKEIFSEARIDTQGEK